MAKDAGATTGSLAASIAAAEQQLPGALQEAETDLADARATATETGPEPGSPIAARLDDAEQGLRTQQIEPAVRDRAPRELAGLGDTRTPSNHRSK